MKITKTFVVCDVGGEKCDNTQLHPGRVTLDGKTKAVTLCGKHAEPLTLLVAGGKPKARAKIYDPKEIRRGR